MEEKNIKEEPFHTADEGFVDPEGKRYHTEFKVDPKLCTCCGQCAIACPVGCITVTELSAVINHAECLSCGSCAAACVVGACTEVTVYEAE